MKIKNWLTTRFVSLVSVFSLMLLCLSFSVGTVAEEVQDKIAADLLQRMEESSESTKIPVTIWVNDIEYEDATITAQANAAVGILKNTAAATTKTLITGESSSTLLCSGDDPAKLNDTQLFIEAKRKIFSDLYTSSNAQVTKTLVGADRTIDSEQVTWVAEYSPIVKMNLTKSQILALAEKTTVDAIYLDDYEIIYPDWEESDEAMVASEETRTPSPYTVWQNATNATFVKSMGYDGTGVKVGVVDGGSMVYSALVAQGYAAPFATLYSEGRLIADTNASSAVLWHAAYCASVIAATDGAIPGIAPGVTLYSTSGNGRTGQSEGAIEWAIGQGCRIVSISMAYPGNNEYDQMSRWLDHIAIQHDVTVVKAAGNDGSTGIPGGGMSYNSIVVGASDDKNTVSRIDDERKSDSSYYAGSALAMKPDIMAPATDIIIPGNYVTGQTSLATPQVAAITALLYQMRPSLESNQAATKAILLAGISPCGVLSGTSVAGSTTTAMLAQTGAGLVDAQAMRYVAVNNRYVGATLASGTKTYTKDFTVSSSDTLTRVCLTWLKDNRISGSHITGTTTELDCARLNLTVLAPDGTTYRSYRLKGNVQLISFVPPTTGTYRITVERATTLSGTSDNVYFGLAWY